MKSGYPWRAKNSNFLFAGHWYEDFVQLIVLIAQGSYIGQSGHRLVEQIMGWILISGFHYLIIH